MQKEIIEYLHNERVGVLAVMQSNGVPHGATLHFAWNEETGAFHFQTFDESIKGKAIATTDSVTATFVVGTNESRMITFQADGTVQKVSEDAVEASKNIFFRKFPEKMERCGPHTLVFTFIPTWWRFTDMKAPGGKLVLASD